MTDFLSKSCLEFWIEFEHINQARNMDSFDITVSQGPNIGTGFDNHIIVSCTGKSLLESLIFASTNPQYEDRLFMELQVQCKLKPGENMLCTDIVSDIQNNFCTPHVQQKEELLTKIYM